MRVCQTIRSLVAARVRVWMLAVTCVGVCVCAVPAVAQGHGPGDRGGMRGHGFMAPAPPPPAMTTHIAPHLGLQLGLGGRWWDESKTIKHLGLRSDQQRRMDEIFEANKPKLVGLLGNLQREEMNLASLPPGDLQDETKVFAAIDHVSEARTELEKAYAHQLLQIRQQLDAGQLEQLDREIANTR